MEIRPSSVSRQGDYEFIVNPIVDIGFGKYWRGRLHPGGTTGEKARPGFLHRARALRRFRGDREFQRSSANSQHTLFAVTDFKLGVFGVNSRSAMRLTPASDRLVIKPFVGYAFPVPNKSGCRRGPVNPDVARPARPYQP